MNVHSINDNSSLTTDLKINCRFPGNFVMFVIMMWSCAYIQSIPVESCYKKQGKNNTVNNAALLWDSSIEEPNMFKTHSQLGPHILVQLCFNTDISEWHLDSVQSGGVLQSLNRDRYVSVSVVKLQQSRFENDANGMTCRTHKNIFPKIPPSSYSNIGFQ